MNIYVVILNYNGFEETSNCIESICSGSDKKLEIVIVDNCSPDGSGDRLRNMFTEHHFLQSGRNGGYGFGVNIGIRYALEQNAEAILVMNNDITVGPGFLEPMVDTLLSNERIGIVSPKVVYRHDPEKIYCAGGEVNYHTCSAVAKYQGNVSAEYGNIPRVIEFAEGCCLLVRSSVFRKIGLFPEQYFMYFEDIHFSFDVRKQYMIQYQPRSLIYHKSGAGTKWSAYTELYNYYYTRNRIIFFSRFQLLYVIYMILFSITVVFMKSLTVIFSSSLHRRARISALWRGLRDGIKIGLSW